MKSGQDITTVVNALSTLFVILVAFQYCNTDTESIMAHQIVTIARGRLVSLCAKMNRLELSR